MNNTTDEIRMFFAIDLPAHHTKLMAERVALLQKNRARHETSWGKPESLHTPVQLLSKLRTQDLPTLLGDVRHQIKHFVPDAPIASISLE